MTKTYSSHFVCWLYSEWRFLDEHGQSNWQCTGRSLTIKDQYIIHNIVFLNHIILTTFSKSHYEELTVRYLSLFRMNTPSVFALERGLWSTHWLHYGAVLAFSYSKPIFVLYASRMDYLAFWRLFDGFWIFRFCNVQEDIVTRRTGICQIIGIMWFNYFIFVASPQYVACASHLIIGFNTVRADELRQNLIINDTQWMITYTQNIWTFQQLTTQNMCNFQVPLSINCCNARCFATGDWLVNDWYGSNVYALWTEVGNCCTRNRHTQRCHCWVIWYHLGIFCSVCFASVYVSKFGELLV